MKNNNLYKILFAVSWVLAGSAALPSAAAADARATNASSASGKGAEQADTPELDFVVKHTAIRDQSETSLCWAYSVLALLESIHLHLTHEEVELSPDHLGFQSVFLKVRVALEALDSRTSDSKKDFEAAFAKLSAHGGNTIGMEDARLLIQNTGVVPKSAFRGVYPKNDAARGKALTRFIDDKLLQPGALDLYKRDPSRLYADLSEVFVGQSLAMDGAFIQNGVPRTPLGYLRDVIGVDMKDFQTLDLTDEANEHWRRYTSVLAYLTLKGGMPVPMGFAILNDSDRGSGVLSVNNCPNRKCSRQGGAHGTLAVGAKDIGSRRLVFLLKDSAGTQKGLSKDLRLTGPDRGYLLTSTEYFYQGADLGHPWSVLLPSSDSIHEKYGYQGIESDEFLKMLRDGRPTDASSASQP